MSGNRPALVGITGGIGAGKSTVARIFKTLGIPVYDADSRAKWLMNNDRELKEGIVSLFGTEAYDHQQINRTHIARLAFSDQSLLSSLNALVHPAVAKDFDHWAGKQATPYVLKEAALLFESGSYQSLSAIITVTADESLRMRRVLKRDAHRTEQDVKKMMAAQWAEDKKVARSQYIITNDETTAVIPQVLKIHEQLLGKISG
ncbi:dephospho-CoA kinase [Marinoscillum sp. 108]|uniref:dephospho-CoA kinase n=1 Tax=Marinoscillum sp. 108 TaxID=2653151 RepID=UPI0012F2B34C|nr:dephospho-CoA kinase [Marinoscillum sp. 108]VXD20780.1 Dephospho-CoA kinase [Marinoscillum sp. 108]